MDDELDRLNSWLDARLVEVRKRQQAAGMAVQVFEEGFGAGSAGLLPQLEKLFCDEASVACRKASAERPADPGQS